MRLRLDSGITVFQGANAQGKTNLLEAIFMLVTGRSFRTREERELMPWGSPADGYCVVRGTIGFEAGEDLISISIQGRKKQVMLNGTPLRRLSDLLGKFRAVLFQPNDLGLVDGAPASRRRLLDLLLVQSTPSHLEDLQRYDGAMRHRNLLLRQAAPPDQVLLDTYEGVMANHGPRITRRREELVELIRPLLRDFYHLLRGSGQEGADAEFLGGWGKQQGPADSLAWEYRQQREHDRIRGHASLGCHRDDFRLMVDGKKASQYASQGQRRTLVVAIKLAEVSCLDRLSGSSPVLMMDDLLSELDTSRQWALLEGLPRGTQTLITATDAHGKLPGGAHIFCCKGGSVERWEGS